MKQEKNGRNGETGKTGYRLQAVGKDKMGKRIRVKG